MNNKYIIYFTEAQMYLFSARTRVRSIEVAKKYANDIISTTKENYTITLIPMKQAQTQANTITNEIVQMSCSKLKRMLASQTK